ncbi:unnamed protein product [Durusdinium trenchii]|uniref:Methyltransferase FkbM domain-containing protein n=1 Tax=Durusdinium trenchii TaxID=1381693 RepID=A0ABP0S1V3_9DINO
MMLLAGLQVVAVEGNPEALHFFEQRLHRYGDDFLRLRLQAINAATGAFSAPPVAIFQVNHHDPETSGVMDASSAEGKSPASVRFGVLDPLEMGGTPLPDATTVPVSRVSCGALYRAWTPSNVAAEYAKIDLEGSDLDCLGSLLRNSSKLPRFVSMEVNLVEVKGKLIKEETMKLAIELLSMLQGSYCEAKLCRQHLYNLRQVPGRGLASRLGWGASGPWGDQAVDWRRGEHWAPLELVLSELFAASVLSKISREWFDLHLRRC